MTADEFALRMTEDCKVSPGSHVLAAVSGGADSVALLCLLAQAKRRLNLTVSCAHVEHGIRGEASLGDMAFVRALCSERGIPLYVERVDVPAYASACGMGLEEAARNLRRACLERIADEIGADCIALAHHALDQAETVLLHAARGSDVRGLCGMQSRAGRIIRPLLGEMPRALRAYLQDIGQLWREDETNLDVAYARNRMRHQAIPALEAAYPGAVQALCRLAKAASRDEAHFAQALSRTAVTIRPLVDGEALLRRELEALDDALLSRLLVRRLERAGLGAQNAGVIDAMTAVIRSGERTTINLQGGGHAFLGETYVCLIREESAVQDTVLRLEGETRTPFGVFTVRAARSGETGDGVTSQVIGREALEGAVVSQRRPGDTMVPFGKRSPVKLKKLVIDAGVERPLRNSLPVIRRGEAVLWAVTLRASAHCRACGDGQGLLVTFRETAYTSD